MLRNTAILFTKMGYNVTALSTGEEAKQMGNGFNEIVVKGNLPKAVTYGGEPWNYAEYLGRTMEGFMGQRNAYNSQPDLIGQLNSLKPDVIVTSNSYLPTAIDILDVLIRYKWENDNTPKLVVLTDDFKAVEEFFALTYRNFAKTHPNSSTFPLVEEMEAHYTRYMGEIYSRMLAFSNAVVFYTDEDLAASRARYPEGTLLQASQSAAILRNKNRRYNHKRRTQNGCLFGHSGNVPNAVAKSTIIERIAPHVPEITFIVAGRGELESNNGNVVVIGSVDNIPKLVGDADLYIAPMTYGTGVQTKLLDPLNAGIPIISTHVGAQGFPATHMEHMVLEDDISRFPSWIRRLRDDKELRRYLPTNAIRDMGAYFSSETVGKTWEKLIARMLRS